MSLSRSARPVRVAVFVACCLALAGAALAVPPAAPPAAAPAAPAAAAPAPAAPIPHAPASAAARPLDPMTAAVGLGNQMMITLMERFKAGDYDKAREIALDMIKGEEKIVDKADQEFRAFGNHLEQMLYEKRMHREGHAIKANWVPQPIADGHYFLSLIAWQEKDAATALAEIEKALKWNPVHAAFYNEKAYLLLQQTPPDLAEAQVAYRFAAELAFEPEDLAAALRGLGFVYLERGDVETALACYLASQRHEPKDPAAQYQVRLILAGAPELAAAMNEQKLGAVLAKKQINPGYDPIHAQILLQVAGGIDPLRGKKELAAVARRILRLDPQNAKAHTILQAVGEK